MDSMPKEKPPNHEEHGQHHGQREFENVCQERGGMDFLVLSDGFDHEIGPVADVGVRAEENGGDIDGGDEAVEAWIAEEKGDGDFIGADGAAGDVRGMILLKRGKRLPDLLRMGACDGGEVRAMGQNKVMHLADNIGIHKTAEDCLEKAEVGGGIVE